MSARSTHGNRGNRGRGPTTGDALSVALEREHHDIDEGIEAFLAGHREGRCETEPLRRAIAALRRHIFLEEAFLFPPLREAGLIAPVFVMLREHGEIWHTVDALEAQLERNAADAAPVAAVCEHLLAQLERHNAKEEPILYPQADAILSPAADAGLRAFLADGRLPEGWVCEQASTGPGDEPLRGALRLEDHHGDDQEDQEQ